MVAFVKITDEPMAETSWAPVVELCGRVMDDLPRVARASLLSIRRNLSDYAAVPFKEHLAAVTEQQRRRLDALAGHRLLADDDLDRAAELARRRARQGVPVDVLIGAYHLGDQELWDALRRDPGTAAPLLPDVASLMLKLLHAISTVLASAHADVTRELHSHRATLSQRLIELVADGKAPTEAERLADSLGLSSRGDFVAAVWRRPEPDVILPPEVRRGLEGGLVPLVHAVHSGAVVMLAQNVEPGWLVELVTRLQLDGGVGIGLRRSTLRGAVLSVGDARLAISAASAERHVLTFADVWAEACLAAESARLEPLLARGAAVAAENPHLASTVLAFAAADMSVGRTADELHLHANSVSYRLQRWGQLSGWDARTFDGLTRSAAACRLALR